jgi:hypothetical protein
MLNAILASAIRQSVAPLCMHAYLFGEEINFLPNDKKAVKNPSGQLFGRTLKLTLKVATCKRNFKISDFVKHLCY